MGRKIISDLYIYISLSFYIQRGNAVSGRCTRDTHTHEGWRFIYKSAHLSFSFFLLPSTAAVVITLPNPSLPINAIKTNRLTRSDSIRPVFPSQPETYLGEASHLISNRKSLSLFFRITKQLEFSSTLSIGSRNLVGCRR